MFLSQGAVVSVVMEPDHHTPELDEEGVNTEFRDLADKTIPKQRVGLCSAGIWTRPRKCGDSEPRSIAGSRSAAQRRNRNRPWSAAKRNKLATDLLPKQMNPPIPATRPVTLRKICGIGLRAVRAENPQRSPIE